MNSPRDLASPARCQDWTGGRRYQCHLPAGHTGEHFAPPCIRWSNDPRPENVPPEPPEAAAGSLDPDLEDRILVNFEAEPVDGGVFVVVQIARDGVAIDSQVLGIVEARSLSIARTLAAIEWKVSRQDVRLLSKELLRLAIAQNIPRRPFPAFGL